MGRRLSRMYFKAKRTTCRTPRALRTQGLVATKTFKKLVLYLKTERHSRRLSMEVAATILQFRKVVLAVVSLIQCFPFVE